MTKDNENKLSHLTVEENDYNETEEIIELGDYNQLISENDFTSSSDCLNNESIGGGDSPNTFVQSEKQRNEEESTSISTQKVMDSEDSISDYNNRDVFQMSDNDSNSSRLSMHQNQSNLKKTKITIIFALILVLLALFIVIKKPLVKDNISTTTISFSPEEEKQMKSILDRITSYYDSESNGNLVLKENVKVDINDLNQIEKDINKVSNEDTKAEFIRLFRQLKEDLINDGNGKISFEEFSSSTVISYNIFGMKLLF